MVARVSSYFPFPLKSPRAQFFSTLTLPLDDPSSLASRTASRTFRTAAGSLVPSMISFFSSSADEEENAATCVVFKLSVPIHRHTQTSSYTGRGGTRRYRSSFSLAMPLTMSPCPPLSVTGFALQAKQRYAFLSHYSSSIVETNGVSPSFHAARLLDFT